MLPQIKAAVALSVTIPVVIIAFILVYIWLHRRRKQAKSPLDEEVVQSFQVNSVHRFVIVDDEKARASPPPFSPDSVAESVRSSRAESQISEVSIPKPINDGYPGGGQFQFDPPGYSDKQVVPDPTLPEVVSGPSFASHAPSSPPAIIRKTSLEEAVECEKKKQRLTADEIIGIDRTFWLQDLPAYQPGRPPVLHVATANLGQPNEFVSPWDVEFKPNPIIFPHLNGNSTSSHPITPISAITANSPSSPTGPSQLEGPFELDAVETVFNPWRDAPRTMIRGVPHRWESTLKTNRMFFDAESRNKKRSGPEHGETLSPQRKRNGGPSGLQRPDSYQRNLRPDEFADLTLESPISNTSSPTSMSSHTSRASSGRRRSQRKASRRQSGRTAARSNHSDSSCNATPLDNEYEDLLILHRPTLKDHDMQWEPTNGKNPQAEPTVWGIVDMSFAMQLAAQHEQQVKFFEKFHNLPITPISPVNGCRGNFIISGGSSPISPTRSSLRSSGSLRTPVTPLSSAASSFVFPNFPGQSTPSINTVSSATTVSMDHLKFQCSECLVRFRTPGLRKNHFNRKHNLRYICEHCNAAFGLRKDLQRHESTVHKNLFPPEIRLLCPIQGCATPLKEFNRKDNFNRHVERCREAVETRGLAQ